MATTIPTGRFLPVPDLVGVKAPEAIARLRQLGLTPVTLPSAVTDVSEAGMVLGIDPPADSPVRSRAKITLSVGTHPERDARLASTGTEPSAPVQPPLTWPRSAEVGLAAPAPEFAAHELSGAPQSAAKPGVTCAPASSSDAAFREFPLGAGSSRADTTAPGAAANPYVDDLSEAVPTPADYAAQDEWDRLRASESARFADDYAPGAGTTEAATEEPPIVTAEVVDLQAERAAEERARRDARRRSARRYRRMSLKQRVVLGGLFGLIVLLIIAAATNKPKLKPHGAGSTATTTTPATPPVKAPARTHAPVKHAPKPTLPRKHKAPFKRRVIVIHRTRTKVVTVTVTTPTSTPTSVGSSYTPPATTSTYTHSSSATTTPTDHAPSASSKPASSHASADKTSSGTGGGSTLQTPNGATAPPTPNQP